MRAPFGLWLLLIGCAFRGAALADTSDSVLHFFERPLTKELDESLIRAEAALSLAKADEQSDLRDSRIQSARIYWTEVEQATVRVLRDLAQQETANWEPLVRRFRPERKDGESFEQARGELRTGLRQIEPGDTAVLLLVRLYAHADQLELARRLGNGLWNRLQLDPSATDDLLAELRNQLGVIEASRGDSDRAIEHFRRAIELSLRNRSRATDAAVGQIDELLATAHDHLGTAFCARGQYELAEQHLRSSLELWRKCSGDLQVARLWLKLASLRELRGDPLDALGLYESLKAWELSKLGPDHPALIEVNCALAEAYLNHADELLVEAERCAQEANASATAQDDHRASRAARNLLATVRFRRGQGASSTPQANSWWDLARTEWRALLVEHQAAGDLLAAAQVLRRLGDVDYAQYQLEPSRRDLLRASQQYYRRATLGLERIGAPPIARVNARLGLARTLAEQKNHSDAADCLEEALHTIEVAGAGLRDSRSQRSFYYEQFTDVYDLLTECLLRDANVERMLYHSEKFRNRIWRDEILNSDIDHSEDSAVHDAGNSPPRRIHALQRQIEFLNAKLRQNRITADERNLLSSLEKDLVALSNQDQELTPQCRELMRTMTREELTEIVDRLADQQDLVLYYYLGDQSSYVCVISDRAPRYFPLEISPSQSQVLLESPSDTPEPLTWMLAVQLVREFTSLIENSPRAAQLSGPQASPDRDTTSGFKTVTDRVCEPTALAAGHDLPSRMENWPEASAFGSGFETGSSSQEVSSESQVRGFQRRPRTELPDYWAARLADAKRRQLKPFGVAQAQALSGILLPEALVQQVMRGPGSPRHVVIVADPAIQRLPFHALPLKHDSEMTSLFSNGGGWGRAQRAPRSRGRGLDARSSRLDPRHPNAEVVLESFRSVSTHGPPAQSEQQYVIDLFPPICYAPSIQVLHLLQKRSSTRRMGKRVLTVGSSLDELTEVEAECGAIAECFPNQIIQPLLVGHRATEGLLRHYAPQSWLVHFAGHAEYPEQQDRRPGQLALQLSKRPWNHLVPPTDNNGELTIAEIYDMDLHRCEAVVLSACSTYRSRASLLDGGDSLARAFLAAGASRVIGTYWRVRDDAARSVMEEFFRYLAQCVETNEVIDYADGLQRAMKRAKRINDSPHHWACFALVGPPLAATPIDPLSLHAGSRK